MKSGAILNFRPRVAGTPMPPPAEPHTGTVHRIGAKPVARQFEPDPAWFFWMWMAGIAFGALASWACIRWGRE